MGRDCESFLVWMFRNSDRARCSRQCPRGDAAGGGVREATGSQAGGYRRLPTPPASAVGAGRRALRSCVGSSVVAMPLENLEEEGLPKNPDLRIAQLRFLLSLPEHRGNAAVREELMAAVRENSEARERRVSGLGRGGPGGLAGRLPLGLFGEPWGALLVPRGPCLSGSFLLRAAQGKPRVLVEVRLPAKAPRVLFDSLSVLRSLSWDKWGLSLAVRVEYVCYP